MAGLWRGLVCGLVLLMAGPTAWSETLLIGSGSETGVYYQAALAICQVMNQHGSGRLLCRGRPTPGSVFNLQAVERGLLDFGLAQSDRQWEATRGEGKWQDRPATTLRSVLSLHAEAVMLVARRDTGIQQVSDIRGHRVNIGNPGSGHRANALDVLALHDLRPGVEFTALELQQDRASRALVDSKLDAFFYTVGNPNEAIAGPARKTEIRIVPLAGEEIRTLLKRQPYLVPVILPTGLYPGVDAPVSTVGVKATLVTRADQSEAVVYTLLRLVIEHLEEIRDFHPALGTLTTDDLLAGLSAPLHPGAERYFREQRLLPVPPTP